MTRRLLPYRLSLAGTLLAARESVMAPIRPHLRESDVTEQQWRVLRVLNDETDLDPSTLAERAILHPPSVTRILRELVERGLIDRLPDENDGRRAILRLTPSGQRLVDLTAKRTVELLDEYAARFGATRLDALRKELIALTQILEGVGGQPATGEEEPEPKVRAKPRASARRETIKPAMADLPREG